MTCIHYGAGYKYQLRRPHVEKTAVWPPAPIVTEWITLDTDGTLTIRAGYAWDGASKALDSKSSMRGSLSHDAFYQLMRMGLLDRERWRAVADAELERICREDGMWGWRASAWHLAVRVFADPASDPAQAEPDQCAPGGSCCTAKTS